MKYLIVFISNFNLLHQYQIAESRKIYAEEKEAEVKLLERSVEELECTINVLESKVSFERELSHIMHIPPVLVLLSCLTDSHLLG